MNSNLTLIIPTINRPQYIRRCLSFYASINFKFNIIIGDSSDDNYANINKKIVEKFCKKLDVSINHYGPNVGFSETILNVCHEADSNFVAIMADDDFIVEKTLIQCIHHLENNEDYVAAHGRKIVLREIKDSKQIKNKHEAFDSEDVNALEHSNEKAIDRIRHHWGENALFLLYSTFKLKPLINALEIIKYKPYSVLIERTLYAHILSDGKWKKFNDIFSIHQQEGVNSYKGDNYFPNYVGGMIKLVTNENFYDNYNYSKDILSKKLLSLNENKNLTENILKDKIEFFFWASFIKYFTRTENLLSELDHGKPRLSSLNIIFKFSKKILFSIPRVIFLIIRPKLWLAFIYLSNKRSFFQAFYSLRKDPLMDGTIYQLLNKKNNHQKFFTPIFKYISKYPLGIESDDELET